MGLPGIDEPSMMEEVVKELQSIIDLPLQIDTSDMEAMERAMRAYNGKPLINSVNGKEEVMGQVFPLWQSTAAWWWACAWMKAGFRRQPEGGLKWGAKS